MVLLRDHGQLSHSVGSNIEPLRPTNRKLLQQHPQPTARTHEQYIPLQGRKAHHLIPRLNLLFLLLPERLSQPTPLQNRKRKATSHPILRSRSSRRKQRIKRRAPPRTKPRLPTRLPRPQRQAAQSPRGTDRPMASQAPGPLLLLHQADQRGAEVEVADR